MMHDIVLLANDPVVRELGTRVSDALINLLIEHGLGKGARAIGRFYKQRFQHSENGEVIRSVERLSPFISELTASTRKLEQEGRLTREQLDAQFDKPEIIASLHSAFDSAVETDDIFKNKTLALVLAERFAAPDESLLSIVTRAAIVSLRDLNAEHLRALALLQVFHLSPSDEVTATQEDYERFLQRFVHPLIDVPVTEMTVRHLASIGLLDYDASGIAWDNLGTPSILTATVTKYPQLIGRPLQALIMRRAHGDAARGEQALQEIRLTPSGIVLASAVLQEVVGLNVNLIPFA